jgi:hypothetical protein
MCIFCASIPAAAAIGSAANAKQIEAKKQAEAAGLELPKAKPIPRITAGVIGLLLIGSITYHSLAFRS